MLIFPPAAIAQQQFGVQRPRIFAEPKGRGNVSQITAQIGAAIFMAMVGRTVPKAGAPAGTWRNGWRSPNGKFATPNGPGRAGEDAVAQVRAAIEAKPGWTVVGKEVSVRGMGGVLRRYDLVARGPSGKLIGIEVKSGTAGLEPQQRAFDTWLNSSRSNTATPVGQNAGMGDIVRALLIKVP